MPTDPNSSMLYSEFEIAPKVVNQPLPVLDGSS
jgi:hypothetical protein